MSRYAPGYTGPMTTAGGVPRGTKATGIKPVTPVTKPGTPGRGRGGMTPPPGMMYGPNDTLIPMPKPGKGKPKKGMAMGGMTKKGYNKGGMANCGASMKPAQGKGK